MGQLMGKRQELFEKRMYAHQQCAHFRAMVAASVGATPVNPPNPAAPATSPFHLGSQPYVSGVSPTAPFHSAQASQPAQAHAAPTAHACAHPAGGAAT
eukprot:6432335-Alexandrium_andersonii.AAC.1